MQVKGPSSGWQGLSNTFGAEWETGQQPNLPIDLHITADSGAEVCTNSFCCIVDLVPIVACHAALAYTVRCCTLADSQIPGLSAVKQRCAQTVITHYCRAGRLAVKTHMQLTGCLQCCACSPHQAEHGSWQTGTCFALATDCISSHSQVRHSCHSTVSALITATQ